MIHVRPVFSLTPSSHAGWFAVNIMSWEVNIYSYLREA